ncbi:MAG: TIGR02281 family clan AA aspartic protease [Rhodobacterales bacterium]|nr:MAG: TIGR02281 family clan AA aspartic protease [Rhodobacterales bacterium]
MDTDQTARLIYLILLGAMLVSWFVVQNRQSLGKTAQHATLWGLIFVAVIAAAGLWSDIRDDVLQSQSYSDDQSRIEVPRRLDGHYHLTLEIDGTEIEFVIDTGATDVVLNKTDASAIGIDVDNLFFNEIAHTANGEVKTARVRLKNVRLGPIFDPQLRASVNDGELSTSLLGMAYLQRFSKIEISNGKMVLHR